MQVQKFNNQPTFGMSYKINYNSLKYANSDEILKLKQIIQKNKPKLDEITQNIFCNINGIVEGGLIKKIHMFAVPNSKTQINRFGIVMGIIKDIILGKAKSVNYFKSINFNDLDDAKLIKSIEKVKDGAFNRFGNAKRVKDIFNEKGVK